MSTESTRVSRQQTLQQHRAADAWKCIADVEEVKNNDTRKEYGSLVRSLPAMIQRDGLGSMMAFLDAKAKKSDPYKLVGGHLSGWVLGQLAEKDEVLTDLSPWILQQDSTTYRRATAEAQAYLLWLKRFAEAKNWGEEQTPNGN